MKVPVSIRSGIIVCSAPPSDATPSIWIVQTGAVNACAHLVQQIREIDDFRLAGSVVRRRCSTRECRRHHQVFSSSDRDFVEINSAARRRPSLGARATTFPASSLTSAPNASNPARCKSMGRVPIAQPPGKETLLCRNERGGVRERAAPTRASSSRASYGASKSATWAAVILCVLSSGVRLSRRYLQADDAA